MDGHNDEAGKTKIHKLESQKKNGMRYTPLKFNMEPENNGFQMGFPFPGTYFQVPC